MRSTFLSCREKIIMSSEITHHCVVVNRANNIFICIEHAHSTSIPMHTSLTHTSSMHTMNMWYEHAAAKCDGLAADGPPVMSDTFLHPFLIPHLAFFPTIHPCTIFAVSAYPTIMPYLTLPALVLYLVGASRWHILSGRCIRLRSS